MDAQQPFSSLEVKFAHLCELARIGFWEWDLERDLVESSSYLKELHGLGPNERITAAASLARYHPEDSPRLIAALDQAKTTGTPFDLKVRFQPARGDLIWARVVGRATLRDGKAVLLFGTFQDVTQQCLTIEALRRSENRYRLLADHIIDVVTLHDMDGRILDISPSFTRQTGMDISNWIGRDAYEVVHPDDRERVRSSAHELNRTGQPGLVEWRRLQADGSYVWVETRSSVILNADGQPTYIVCVTRDISERKAAEAKRAQLKQRLQQTEKYESLGILAGGVAHDFNNLLTSILGFAELTINDLPAASPLVSNLREIVRAAQIAASICQQLLTFAGKDQKIFTELALDQVVREALSTLTDIFTEQTRLEIDLPSEAFAVSGNREQLEAVVRGLVNNAVEALSNGVGTVTVRLDRVSVTEPQDISGFVVIEPRVGQYARLSVRDTGQGIAESLLPRLFEPFFSTKFTGRGLGLAAILGTVRSHGGFITVESILEQGSTFSVYLPRIEQATVAEVALPSAREQTGQPATPTVLIVEDDPVVREVASLMLQNAGWRVLTAEDGLAGLEIVQSQSQNISVVLLDLLMPRMDGLQTLERLEKIAPNLRVVVMSGYHEQQFANLLQRKNVVRFVQKPFTSVVLNQALLTALAATPTE